MAQRPNKLRVKLVIQPGPRSPNWVALWRWLLGPAPDEAKAEASQAPAEGEVASE
jgi:hypothetical protein